MNNIAHVNKMGNVQNLEAHLNQTSEVCSKLAVKIGIPNAGKLIGLMHDFGKYSSLFQRYIQSATDILSPDTDNDYIEFLDYKGKIDHSTAGAQWIWQNLSQIAKQGGIGELCGQILAVCVASHHSGLIDCLDFDTENPFAFQRRICKADHKTHLQECIQYADSNVLDKAWTLASQITVKEMYALIKPIMANFQRQQPIIGTFELGHYTRFLFSCLIDADRIDSMDFEFPTNQQHRRLGQIPHWNAAIAKLEAHLARFELKHPIDQTRQQISQACLNRAKDPQGTYTLSVPTGGGKTLASLRYALHHAQHHQLERIVFIIPYTSIIEQNARAVREVLGQQPDGRDWILEHHSNIEPERQTWLSKLISDNWDAPIVFTTMVQYLEANFSGGTRSVRRLHQLANSVLIFDEIQTLPIPCVHLFANSLNFFKRYTRTTSILCTATQPLLHQLEYPGRGQIELSDNPELMGAIDQVAQLFDVLERVEILPRLTAEGWSLEQIVDLIMNQFEQTQSVLVIVNTKAWAQQLYQACQNHGVAAEHLFHLSTNQCPAHRKELLDGITAKQADGSMLQKHDGIRQRLAKKQPVLCISTQLIEAGVDISAGTVIRFLAGLDSIAQAAGRCNRHGEQVDEAGQPCKGQVFVINPSEENLDKLTEIKEGRTVSERIFGEIERGELLGSVLSPQAIQRYFQYYFYKRSSQMNYPFEEKEISDNILNLLSENNKKTPVSRVGKAPFLLQSFKQAGEAFKAIDAPTHTVIVPYSDGKKLIADLFGLNSEFPDFYQKLRKLQRLAQKYSVNVFPHVWHKLNEVGAITEVPETGIYTMEDQYYSDEYGLSVQADGKMDFYGF